MSGGRLKYPRNITIERIQNFVQKDGQFHDVNLQALEYLVAPSTAAITLAKYSVPISLGRISFAEAMKGAYEPAELGVQYGPTWSTHWFKVDIEVPQNYKGHAVTLIFDPQSEALIWSDDGHTLMGITGGGGDNRHVDYELLKQAQGGEKIKLWIEVAANSMFGEGMITMIGPTNPNKYFTLETCQLVVLNPITRSLYWDLDVLLGIAKEMPEDSQIANDALNLANQIINSIFPDQPASLVAAKALATHFFESRKRSLQTYVPHQITAIGNCHIDTAWLWPYGETKRKAARSWTTQCDNIDNIPGYTFAASQMQQFEWTENLYPLLFERIKKLTKEGNFIPIGGTWVEMDCNIPSGESFCRQFLYGQSYLKEKFGFHSSVFWLPDTFGYSAQLPQIIRSAGLKYFFTQKLSWNNINKFPHTTFNWVGLDGSSVLTHFSPADTYTAQASVKDFVFMVKNNKDKRSSNRSLLLYGNGDGGGGPLRHMVERIKRCQDITDLPASISLGNPETFYKELEETSTGLSEWKGELYFELHRGTYTTHGLIKKYNRKCEFLMREVELIWSLAIAQKRCGWEAYPKKEIDRLWKLLLLNQFHDVLPGSSITIVYEDATAYFEDIVLSGSALIAKGLELLATKSTEYYVANPTSWTRRNVLIEVEGELASKCKQIVNFYGVKKGLILVEEISPLSFNPLKSLKLIETPSVPVKVSFDFHNSTDALNEDDNETSTDDFVIVDVAQNKFTVENGLIRVVFDGHGRIVEYFDLVNKRNVIQPGTLGNVFKFYEDIPLFWDAWDVEIYHLEKGWDAGVGVLEVIESGPFRVVLQVVHKISDKSTLDQRITILSGSDSVSFTNDIFWQENRKILKVQFPVAVQHENATYETQFGVLERPTHSNNSWDTAKFEVCGHKFVDLSEFGYGVALLNDSKYGFSVRENVISMSILRAPKAPDDKCDLGRQSFAYALQPHAGTFAASNIVQRGYEFNLPAIVKMGTLHGNGSVNANNNSFFSVNHSNIVIDTIKKAEKENALIVRIFEAYGGRGTVTLSSAFKIESVRESNVIEESLEIISTTFAGNASSFDVTYTPFKVITLLVKLA